MDISNKRLAAEFLSRFDNPDAMRGMSKLLGSSFIDNDRLIAKLQSLKSEQAEALFIPFLNDPNYSKRNAIRKLLQNSKTEPAKLAAQCVADLKSSSETNRNQISYAVEYLEKLSPQPDSEIATALGELIEKQHLIRYQEKLSMICCSWSTQSQLPKLQELANAKSNRVSAFAIKRLLQIDIAEGQKALKSQFAKNTRRHDLNRMLVELGSKYEMAVHPLLSTSDEPTVILALGVLEKIGTRKSVAVVAKVSRVARQRNRRSVQRAAENTLSKIRARKQ